MAEIDPQEQQTLEQLESDVQAMQWEQVNLAPDAASLEEIEQGLPDEWTQLEAEQGFTQEELQSFLDAEIDIPEGDIDQNAEQALQELEIDLDAIAAERDPDLDLNLPEQEHDFDFGR